MRFQYPAHVQPTFIPEIPQGLSTGPAHRCHTYLKTALVLLIDPYVPNLHIYKVAA